MVVLGDLMKNGNCMYLLLMGCMWLVEVGWDLYVMIEFYIIVNFVESLVDENILWVGIDDGII